MKKKDTVLQTIIAIVLLALLATSCTQINKVRDIVTNPSAKELYERELKDSPRMFALWEEQAAEALFDSVAVNLPYAEKGIFAPQTFPVYSYNVTLNPGERLQVAVDTDSINTLVFIDLYRQQTDSLGTFKKIKSAKYEATALQEEISQPGIYKILVQPEVEANTPFQLQLYREPVYRFPVAGGRNSSIQSRWGATRDGGRRSHEGIDIFAPRGTPVVAATSGRVTSTGNKGLGGKQVWVRDRERGNSLYYAHLDSIIAVPGMSVSPGDTLGLVGNTGNARTTPPHLHFGIYKGYRGAVDPFFYVAEAEKPEVPQFPAEEITSFLVVKSSRANLRTGPSTRAAVIGAAGSNDTLRLLGRTEGWYHVNSPNHSKSFIHESLVSPLMEQDSDLTGG